MLRHAPAGVEVLGAHPLFCPDSDSRGMTIVLVPAVKSGRWPSVIRGIFTGSGYNVIETTAEEHDRAMAVVQGMTHFMYVAMGRALDKSGVDLEELSAFKTPVYGITQELLGRVLSQDPGLYALIQSSPDAQRLRRAYVDACRELADGLDAGDSGKFIAAFESAARHYGDTAGARRRSERIIYALKDEEKKDD